MTIDHVDEVLEDDDKIISKKLLSDETELRTLEIGCGENPNLNYGIHMDTRKLPHVEIVGKWQEAVLPESILDKIFANQVIEHLYRDEQLEALRRSLLWLKPGGILEIWTPCLDRLAILVTEGSISWNWFQEVLYGSQDYPDNCHRWVHTLSTLATMVLVVGFEVLECVEIDGSIKLIARKPT